MKIYFIMILYLTLPKFSFLTKSSTPIINNQMDSKRHSKIQVNLKINKTFFGKIQVSFQVKNISDKNITFCTWQSPLEKTYKSIFFELIHNGNRIKYIGKKVKRSSPTKDVFFTLTPNETITYNIDLIEGYKISSKGEYQIRFLGSSINHLPNSEFINFTIK